MSCLELKIKNQNCFYYFGLLWSWSSTKYQSFWSYKDMIIAGVSITMSCKDMMVAGVITMFLNFIFLNPEQNLTIT